ncbi:MAG: hypothetical protein COB67_02965 [SAR324 cluster bacterium]|uniref:SAM-dependent MTase RsmB/NOP-type domain-containing protein n=1 Tax=SAR324 cluster bacterium TaxID=2024889 RepID=A0A2A4T8C6_9DELT|nr:MAG: hypothetical protein COB67_02965 [SAR324 cluster bacterium]
MQVFQEIHSCFLQQRPVDQHLSRFFRRNSQFGSRDRRWISATIFGYYRWYGWLKQLSEQQLKLALLLGYLLDGNEVNELTLHWGKQLGFEADWFLRFESHSSLDLEKKSKIVAEFIQDSTVDSLNPNFIPKLDLQLITSLQTRPHLWIRLLDAQNQSFPKFLDKKGINYSAHPTLKNALAVHAPVNLHESMDFKKGKLEVQDLSSQIIGLICKPQPGENWWDVCSGSGGKALHLAALMNGTGKIYATDIRHQALKECAKRMKRAAWKNITPQVWDGQKLPEALPALDGILVDAPCSCSGTWRRSPDIRWSLSKEKVLEFAELQFNILKQVAPVLPAGKTLVYATCSILPEENEQVIARFLKEFPEYCLLPMTHPLTGDITTEGLYLLPPEVDGNGMFVAALTKR